MALRRAPVSGVSRLVSRTLGDGSQRAGRTDSERHDLVVSRFAAVVGVLGVERTQWGARGRVSVSLRHRVG